MRDRLKEILANVLGLDAAEIPDRASPETLPQWDSLKHLELMLALEMQLGMHIPTEAMLNLQSLDDIEAFVTGRDGQ